MQQVYSILLVETQNKKMTQIQSFTKITLIVDRNLIHRIGYEIVLKIYLNYAIITTHHLIQLFFSSICSRRYKFRSKPC